MPPDVLEMIAMQVGPNASMRMAGAGSRAVRSAVAHVHRQAIQEVRDAFLERLRMARKALQRFVAQPRSDTRQSRRVGKRVTAGYVYEANGVSTYFRAGPGWAKLYARELSNGWAIDGYIIGDYDFSGLGHGTGIERVQIDVFSVRHSPSGARLVSTPVRNARDQSSLVMKIGAREAVERYRTEMRPLFER